MAFEMVVHASGLSKRRNGKGTTYSRAVKAPLGMWASAPEGSRRRPAWAVVVLLTICAGSPMIVHSQNTESITSRTHRAPRGCAYMRASIPMNSANVVAPREFARSPAIVGSPVSLLFEAVDYFPPTFLEGEVAKPKPNWLISAPLRVTQIRPRQGEVLLCGFHGVNDSE